MASIHKRGERWQVRWRNRGEARQRAWTCLTHADARAVKLAAESAWSQGRRYDGPSLAHAARLTLRTTLTEYLRERRTSLSPGSLYQLNIGLTQFVGRVEDRFGDGLDCLTKEALVDFHAYLTTERSCSPSTVHMRVRFAEAFWRWLDDEHEGRVQRPRRLRLSTPPPPPPPVAPTWAEMDAAIAAAPGWHRYLYTVLRCTGLRTTQALRLRRDDLDLERGLLTVRGELGKSVQERRGRVVPVTPHLVAAVRAWPTTDYLVPVPEGQHRIAWHNVAVAAWERARVREEVWRSRDPGRNAHPLHCFRAGFITGLRAAGVAEDAAQFLVGHAGSVTRQRYTDADALGLREVVALVPAIGEGATVARIVST